MSLEVTVLGADGSYAGPAGACTGYLVRSEATTLWLDTGPGTLGRIQEHVALADLDAVVVSHEHPDHFGELPVLYNAIRYYEHRPLLPVHTTAGVQALTTQINGHDCTEAFEWHIHDETSTASIGDIEVSFSRTDHPVETLAVRLESGGRSLVFSSDTGPGWTPAAFGTPVDLLLCEATILAHQEPIGPPHLSARQAAARAVDVDARSLVLTHLTPGTEPADYVAEAATVFDGPIDVARPGRTFTA